MTKWKFHNAFIFFRLITAKVPQRAQKISSITTCHS